MEKLGINWGLLFAQIINVALLVIILKPLLYDRVIGMLNERTQRIQDSLQEADRVRAEFADTKQESDAELARARQEAAGILQQAQERGRGQEQEIVAQARQEADRIRAEAREQGVQERDQLVRDLKNQMAQLVTITAERVLGEELKSNHDRLIQESLASLDRRN